MVFSLNQHKSQSKVASYAVAAPYAYALPYAVAAVKTGCINSVGSVVPCAV